MLQTERWRDGWDATIPVAGAFATPLVPARRSRVDCYRLLMFQNTRL